MDDDNIIGWFSLENGQHVPLRKGESKKEATSKFLKNRMSRVERNKDKYKKIDDFQKKKQSNRLQSNKIKEETSKENEFEEERNDRIIKFVKRDNTFIPVREGEDEKDVVRDYENRNSGNIISYIKEQQDKEKKLQAGIRQSLGEKGEKEVLEAQKRKGTLVTHKLNLSDLKTKTTKEIMDMEIANTPAGKKAFVRFLANNKAEIQKELDKRDYSDRKNNNVGKYMSRIASNPKEGDIIIGGGENGETVRVGKNGKLERIPEDNYKIIDGVKYYVGKNETINRYKQRKGK